MTGDASTQGVRAPDGGPLTSLDAGALRRWAHLVARRLHDARAELDALNVFPVPDGDTGTNLHLTVSGALADHGGDLARALLVNARGNSGVIASQLVRGWADVLGVRDHGLPEGMGAPVVAKALRRGDDLAWAAVTDPVEGTVLSVSRAAADAAERLASAGAGLPALVDAVLDAAGRALDRTPLQLPALAAAGVVDAGGAGLVLALRALRDVVSAGGVLDGAGGVDRAGGSGSAGGSGEGGAAGDSPAWSPGTGAEPVEGDLSMRGLAGTDLSPDGPAYEVMYLLGVDGPDEEADGPVGRLREALVRLGDSVLVVGGEQLWHVHVHTDDPGAAVEAGLAVGSPHAIRITHFAAAGVAPRPAAADESCARVAAPERAALAVVACAGGAGTVDLCRETGAVVVTSAPGERASTGDVLDAVLAAGAVAERVLVLPNDAETAAVAHQAVLAAEEQGVTAVVARSRSQVQVLAALAVIGPGTPGGGDVLAAMQSVATTVDGCRHGAVAVAVRDCVTAVGPCRTGDLVGTLGRDVVAVGSDPVDVAAQVVTALGGSEAELLTVLPGRDADADLLQRLRERLETGGAGPQVDVVGGGQPRYLLLLGAE